MHTRNRLTGNALASLEEAEGVGDGWKNAAERTRTMARRSGICREPSDGGHHFGVALLALFDFGS